MKKIIFAIVTLLLHVHVKSQLSGTLNVPLNYTSVAAVVAALNQQGVSGPVTINIAAGYTETAISGGYSLTASGSVTSPIVFQKSGLGINPLIVAYGGGNGTPGSMNQDGIWCLIGSDYITIDGIDLFDQNTANPATMEFGYGLFKINGSDGCQNNTIKNCMITLNKINNSSGSGPAMDGSRGIDVVNAGPGVHNSALIVSTFAGSNSNNKFYSNTIQNCNIGISLIGYVDVSPFSFADTGNDIGGNSIANGNTIINFGGGGSVNAAAAIRTLAQYNLNVSYNSINNNNGAGVNHTSILRGIYLNTATSANATINNNTLTLNGGGTNSQLSVIENISGATPFSNTITINNNLITNCTYASSTSGSFYGIWNTASSANLNVHNNTFLNNSTSALSGSTYLIYNNGAVASLISITNNNLEFTYNGLSAYSGIMYSIYNANGTPVTSLDISHNNFSNYNYPGFPGTGNLYFIHNNNDCLNALISNNTWSNLSLNHSGAQYLIYNSTSTQSVLSVNHNSIVTAYRRIAAAGATYLYYSTGSSLANSSQVFTGNNFSNIMATVAGTGNFYGIYNGDGAGSPYPKKTIYNNVISNVNINSTGTFYGFYLDNLGDGTTASGSAVYSNTLSTIARAGIIYGMYISGAVSPMYAPKVYSNYINNLTSSGASSNLYSVYLAGGGAGLNFYKNKINDITETGASGLAHGVYVASAISTTLANNFIGNISAPNSSAANALNGIYISGGNSIHVFYNTVFLNAVSSGGNFNSNAIYASSTASLNLRNNIFVNTSSGGTGITASYRRSSTSLTTYSSSSNNNLFYAGTPGTNNVILQSGTTPYQTLGNFQAAVNPRDANSVTQNVSFLNTSGFSQNYLHVTPNLASPAESGAVNVGGITDDFENDTRHGNLGYAGSGAAPDIGADEYDQNLSPCSGANAGTIYPLSYSMCAGQTVSLISNGYTPGVGLSHQWRVSTVTGGPYINVTGGTGSSTPEYISSQLGAGIYYFVMVTTCTSIPVSASSAEATVIVNAVPVASASAAASLVCAGQNINLVGATTSGTSFNWTGPYGFNSAAQNPTITNSTANTSGIYYLSVSANNCSSPQSSIAVTVSDVTLSLSASPPVVCSGNSSTLSLSTSANSYTWNNGSASNSIVVTPSITTVYNVIATNTANCVTSKSITIAVIHPTIMANNVIACGNSATAALSVDAFTPSVINWYPSINSSVSLASGINYTVNASSTTTVYAEASNSLNGCMSPRVPVTLIISPYPILTVAANPSTVCPGKPSTLTATGASTYSWLSVGSGSVRTVAPISNHVYTVTGKNTFGCATTGTILLSTYTLASISVAQTATSVCPSGVVSFTASGANTYIWNTGANGSITTVTPAVNSTYTVYGANTQSCTSSATPAVVTRSVPVISIRQSTNSICAGEAVTFTASGASSYTWLPGNKISAHFTVNPLVTAVYNAIGRSPNSCTNVAIAGVEVNPCTEIDENTEQINKLKIFPNPSQGLMTLLFSYEGKKEINIFSPLGNLIFGSSTIESFEKIGLSGLSAGIYFIRVNSKNATLSDKIILQ
jgi:hypothetical protein